MALRKRKKSRKQHQEERNKIKDSSILHDHVGVNFGSLASKFLGVYIPGGRFLFGLMIFVVYIFIIYLGPRVLRIVFNVQKKTHVFSLVDNNAYNIIQEAPSWNTSDPILNQTNNFLSHYVCTNAKGYCHPLLRAVPERRTHNIVSTTDNSTVLNGETVLILPRHLMIWDLDALRHDFIHKELMGARHDGTKNALDSGAFLAVFLVLLKENIDGPHQNYISMLPTYKMLKKVHPTQWPEPVLTELFGKHTLTFMLIRSYKDMIESEYSAFCKVYPSFTSRIPEEEYFAMRLNVMSRSFGPGPPGPEERRGQSFSKGVPYNSLEEELAFYKKEAGVDLTKGCRAMSPILDMWDHHVNPNVLWTYDRTRRAFIITAGRRNDISNNDDISSGQNIIVSYGKYTDSHLFAKFGFVNGDGSGHTEASISLHRLLDAGMGQQFSHLSDNEIVPAKSDMLHLRHELLQYLSYDDGYFDCITPDGNLEGFRLKQLKLRLLERIAMVRHNWVVTMSPRNKSAIPDKTLSTPPNITGPPRYNSHNVKFDGSKLISTCRLISLTNDDYDGKAIEELSTILNTDTNYRTFSVKRQSDELEFRSLACLRRLAMSALRLYPTNVKEDLKYLGSKSAMADFMSNKWLAANVRLGEMQVLEVLENVAASGTEEMMRRVKKKNVSSIGQPPMFLRSRACPFELSSELLKGFS